MDALAVAIDHVYSDEYVTLAIGLSLVTLSVFADQVLFDHRYAWELLVVVFLGTLLMYRENPVLPLMVFGVVCSVAAASASRGRKKSV